VIKLFQDHSFSDFLGISASILCLLHCIALPIIFISFGVGLHSLDAPEYGLEYHDGHTEFLGLNLDYIFAIFALLAAYISAKRAHFRYIKVLLGIGWVVFIAGVYFHHELFYLMHIGSALLIFAHIQNLRACRKKACNVEYNTVKA